MDCESGREPLASELPDDLEDTRVISGLPNEAAKIRRMKLPVFAWRSSDQAMQLLLSRIKHALRFGICNGPRSCTC